MSDGRVTVAQFLDRWLEDSVRTSVRPNTYEAYESHVRRHLKPTLGTLSLDKLTPDAVQRLLRQKLDEGLSPATVSRIRATLRRALVQAEKWGLVSRNVAKLVDPPKVPRFQVNPLTPDEARSLLNATSDDRLHELYVVALTLGLRQGEALALRWADVDLERKSLAVRHTLQHRGGEWIFAQPKSERSIRNLRIPELAVAALRRQRATQGRDRLISGDRWVEYGLVFATARGTPLNASNVTHRLQRSLAEAGLPKQRFHDLRHACATFLLAQGVAPRVVMETLGHSQIALTMNTYSHVMPSLQQEAADRMDALLGG